MIDWLGGGLIPEEFVPRLRERDEGFGIGLGMCVLGGRNWSELMRIDVASEEKEIRQIHLRVFLED